MSRFGGRGYGPHVSMVGMSKKLKAIFLNCYWKNMRLQIFLAHFLLQFYVLLRIQIFPQRCPNVYIRISENLISIALAQQLY